MSQTLIIRSPEVPKCEIPKTRNRRTTRSIEYRISATERWRCQRLSSTGVPKSRNVKWRNDLKLVRGDRGPLIHSISKYWLPGFRLPGDGDVRDSHQQESRNREMRNGEMI
jgi:hypothetical protein